MSTKSKKTSPKLVIDLQYASPAIESALKKISSPTLMKKWVKCATPIDGVITLRFVNAAEGENLNLAYRKKNYATNVLTFSYALSKNALATDIILCFPVVKKEAKDQSKSLNAHLAHLIVHGCLHAQGHDHEIVRDAKKMEALEVQILQKLGFANPYS